MRGLAVLGGVSYVVKAGWLVWLAWCAGLILWYRLGRSDHGDRRPSRGAERPSGFGLGLTSAKFESAEVGASKSRRSGRRQSVVDDPTPIAVLQ